MRRKEKKKVKIKMKLAKKTIQRLVQAPRMLEKTPTKNPLVPMRLVPQTQKNQQTKLNKLKRRKKIRPTFNWHGKCLN